MRISSGLLIRLFSLTCIMVAEYLLRASLIMHTAETLAQTFFQKALPYQHLLIL